MGVGCWRNLVGGASGTAGGSKVQHGRATGFQRPSIAPHPLLISAPDGSRVPSAVLPNPLPPMREIPSPHLALPLSCSPGRPPPQKGCGRRISAGQPPAQSSGSIPGCGPAPPASTRTLWEGRYGRYGHGMLAWTGREASVLVQRTSRSGSNPLPSRSDDSIKHQYRVLLDIETPARSQAAHC